MPVSNLPSHSDELPSLHARLVRLETVARRRGRALAVTSGVLVALGMFAAFGALDVHGQLESCRAKLVESRQGHSALARAHGNAAPVRHVVIQAPDVDPV